MVLALRQWVEKGTAPESIIGAYYPKNKTVRRATPTLLTLQAGAEFTRRLCPLPQAAKYTGGDQNNATSYTCEVRCPCRRRAHAIRAPCATSEPELAELSSCRSVKSTVHAFPALDL